MADTAMLPWRGGRKAGKGVPPPPLRRRPANPTEKAGVKNRHNPIQNYAGFLNFGTHHRARQGTQVLRKKSASVRQ